MNTLLFKYSLVVFLIALSPRIDGAQASKASSKQIAFHPDVEWFLKTEPSLPDDIKAYLHSKEALNHRTFRGEPLLVNYALKGGHFMHMAELLSAGADVDATDKGGYTALIHSLDKPLQLQLLLDYKAEVNVSVCKYGTKKSARMLLSMCCSAMHSYSPNEHRESLGKLVSDPRIDVNKQDADGSTPLLVMVNSEILNERDLLYINKLIECGANPLCATLKDGNALHCLGRQAGVKEKVPLCKAILQSFDEQRKAAVGALPAILECTPFSSDLAKLVFAYTYPAFTHMSIYHVLLDATLKDIEKAAS